MKANRFQSLFWAALILLLPLSAFSQRKVVLNMPTYDNELLHYGFALAVNQLFVSIRPIENLNNTIFQGDDQIPDINPMPDYVMVQAISCEPGYGFTVSILGDLRVGDHFNFRFVPSFLYGSRQIKYTLAKYNMDPTEMKIKMTSETILKDIPSTYINFPFEFKFKAKRYNNFRPYLMAGALYSLDLSSDAKKRINKNPETHIVRFEQSDFYIQGGVGFDFYNEWFKFGVELKMMYGLNDMLTHDGTLYTESIDRISSKIFQLALTFE